MKRVVYAVLALLSLALCLLFPIRLFLGDVTFVRYKFGLIFSSLAWLVFATLWAAGGKAGKKP